MAGEPGARVEEILERATSFYERVLWATAEGESIRSRLARQEVGEGALRAFGVGYAPGDATGLIAEVGRLGYSDTEVRAAGIANLSERGRLHVHFRSRIMFPVRDREGRILGFAGLATHPGPSWPRWVTSPETGLYRRSSALFGIEHASRVIASASRAVVVRDCLHVLRLHRQGHREAVAIVRSGITKDHLATLAAELGAQPDELGVEPGRLGVPEVDCMIVQRIRAGAALPRATVGRSPSARSEAPRERRGVIPDELEHPSPAVRALQATTALAIGVLIPVGWVSVTNPGGDSGGEAIGAALAGIAASYLVLAIVAGAISGRVRARSRSKRMREAWERSLTEWQPAGWTYHAIEEVLIGAALISALTLVVLMITVGELAG